MLPQLSKIKGIHPGALLKWELDHRNLKSSVLAQQIGEHKQTISAIINRRRKITPQLSIKLAKVFDTQEDYFMLLQASHDVKMAATIETKGTPNLQNLRKVLFWDTDIQKIDWDRQKRAVIQRILERGNDTEIQEIISFYGREAIFKEIKSIKNSHLPTFEQNIKAYNLI